MMHDVTLRFARWLPVFTLAILCSCGSGPSDPAARPDLLLISIDTCRADHLGCYGGPAGITPHIDALAAEGTLFEHALSPVPMTLPAHATMLTGLDPLHHGIHDNYGYRLAASHPTLPEILGRAGYTTAAIVSAAVLDSTFGLDRGFTTYDDAIEHPLEKNAVVQRRGDETTQRAIAWLESHAREPFFLFLHYFDPHANYDPPEPFLGKFLPDRYAGEIAYVDHCIGRVLDKLKDLGIDETTLVVITADHGEMLGEHGEDTHSYFIYQGALRVPLILKLPGARSAEGRGPRRLDGAVGLVDIVPTICGLLGVPVSEPVQGIDLSAVLQGVGEGVAGRRLACESFTPARYGAGALVGLVRDHLKYVRGRKPELFDLVADPFESTNLAEARPDLAAAIGAELQAMLEVGGREGGGSEHVDDDEQDAMLAALGYVGGRIDERSALDPDRPDAADLLYYHIMAMQVERLLLLGDYETARPVAEEMVRRNPDCVLGYRYLFNAAFKTEDYARAHKRGVEALRLDPDDARLWRNMAATCVGLGRIDEAIADYLEVLKRRPDDALARTRLGEILARAGRVDEAVRHLDEALRIDPELAEAHHALGNAYRARGDSRRARAQFERALELEPQSAPTHYNLANLLASQGRFAAAVEHYEQVLEIAPDHGGANYNLGWFLAVDDQAPFHDPDRAVGLLEKAGRVTKDRQAETLGALGVAEAAAGDMRAAIRSTEKAIELAGATDQTELVTSLREKLRLYRAGRPYREHLAAGGKQR